MSYIYEKCSYIHEYKNYSTTDVSIRLEAVLNGRVMQPPGDSGDSPTEGPEMLDLVEGLVGEGEHSLLTDFEINERIRNFRAKNYGGRTPGTLIWSADGEVRICENRWKVQSLGECYSYIYEEGEEPVPFDANFAQVDPQICAGGRSTWTNECSG